MWAVSDRFLATLSRPHTKLIYVEILKAGQVYTTMQSGWITDPATGARLGSIGGTVQVSRSNIRRTLTLNVFDAAGLLMPMRLNDLLAPYVTEIRVWSGVRYWDAPLPALSTTGTGFGIPVLQTEEEYVPVGTFVITDIDSQYPQLTLQGSDRMWYLSNFDQPYTIPAGQKAISVLSQLLARRVPARVLDLNFPDEGGEHLVPASTYDADQSIADAAHAVATATGWVLYTDPVGRFTAQSEPTINNPTVYTYAPGDRGQMLGHPKRTAGGPDPHNAVVFTNESGTVAVRGYAQDNNPNSLTYVARIGLRPQFQSSPIITTVEQANKAAQTALIKLLGLSSTITFQIVPNPAYDTGDVLHVTDPTIGIDDDLIIDSFSVPLRAADGAMEITCRPQVTL